MRAAVLSLAEAALFLPGSAAAAGGGSAFFKQNCSSCHTVGGGDGVGPDLKGVVTANNEQAIAAFIADPGKAIAGDPRLAALVKKFHGLTMPNLGLSQAQIAALVTYLGAGAREAVPAAAKPVGGNAAAGKNLFTGATQLAHGGAACISCHTVAGTGKLGGGRVGPDLSLAASRFGGAKGLASVLSNIAFPAMAPVYRSHPLTRSEQADLAAFLASSRQTAPSKAADHTPLLVLLGAGVTAAILALMLVVWPRRRLVVRKRIAPTSTIRRA
jgi:mono/diheme cytochrome c family protein